MKKEIKVFFKKYPDQKIKSSELAKKLHSGSDEEYAQLKEQLYILTKEGFLTKQGKRYSLTKESEGKLIGTFQLSREGTYGFVIMKNSNLNDVFIPEKYFNTAMNGDTVQIELVPKQRGKNIEGKIIEIIKRKFDEVIGTLRKQNSTYFVVPDSSELLNDFYIASTNLHGARDGDKVVIGGIKWEKKNLHPEGKIIEVLGKEGTYDTEIKLIAKEMNLSYQFPKLINRELNKVFEEIPQSEIDSRLDLRKIVTFTIDPEDAKDFDDAVSISINKKGNYEVGIHIADVSHFVRKGTEIYNEAMKRGTSVYLVGSVIPMLPEKLSNNICSLVPNKDRLTYSVIAELTNTGKVESYLIKKSIINSKKRFTYDEVQEILNRTDGEYYDELSTLNNISKILKKKRLKKGSINFIRPEVKFELSNDGTPINLFIKQVKESHNLIEELMLLANQIVATHINKNKVRLPFVYRIHDVPEDEKIREFERFVRSLGYNFNTASKNKSRELQQLLDQVKGSPEESVINEIAIRSMAKAIYSIDNIGHYGLGFKFYSHFTSPIRRFPDLVIHKLLFNYLENNLEESYSLRELIEICNHSSNQERNAINAERLSTKLKQIEYLRDKIGHEYDGIISGVTYFGIFVEISENLAEGLIRLRNMEDDFYKFDEKHYSVVGRDTHKKYRLGDRVKVKLIEVDAERKEIDFKLLN